MLINHTPLRIASGVLAAKTYRLCPPIDFVSCLRLADS